MTKDHCATALMSPYAVRASEDVLLELKHPRSTSLNVLANHQGAPPRSGPDRVQVQDAPRVPFLDLCPDGSVADHGAPRECVEVLFALRQRRAPAVHGLAGDVRKLFEELILRFLPHVGHVLPEHHFHRLSHDPAVLGGQVQHVKIEHEIGGVVRVHRTSRSLALLSPCVWCPQMSSTYRASWLRLLMSECGVNTAGSDSSAMWQFTAPCTVCNTVWDRIAAHTRISRCTSGKTEGDTDSSRNRLIKVVSARRDVKCIHPLVLLDDPLQILAETARITSSFIAGMIATGVSRHSSGRFLGARFFSLFAFPCPPPSSCPAHAVHLHPRR